MKQEALPLPENPDDEVMLRDAFLRCGLARQGYRFEEWISADPVNKRCLVNVNEARLKAQHGAPHRQSKESHDPTRPHDGG